MLIAVRGFSDFQFTVGMYLLPGFLGLHGLYIVVLALFRYGFGFHSVSNAAIEFS